MRPPLDHLERLLGHSYELLAQLTAVKTMLLQRRGRLNAQQIQGPLHETAQTIAATLSGSTGRRASAPADDHDAHGPVALPDPFEHDLTPWLVRRLQLATGISQRLRADGERVQAASGMV